MTWECPCCGKPQATKMTEEQLIWAIGPVTVRSSIVRALKGGKMLKMNDLIREVYKGAEPNDAEASLRVILANSRAKFASFGWKIHSSGPGRGGTIYTLMPCEPVPLKDGHKT